MQAGNDLLVETEGQDYVCNKAPDCRKIGFPKAMHEILNEVDPIRDKADADIASFLGISK